MCRGERYMLSEAIKAVGSCSWFGKFYRAVEAIAGSVKYFNARMPSCWCFHQQHNPLQQQHNTLVFTNNTTPLFTNNRSVLTNNICLHQHHMRKGCL